MKRGHTPLRTCKGCFRRAPKSGLVRLAAGAGGISVMGQGGRGMYVCQDAACVERALRRKDVSSFLGVRPDNMEIEMLKQQVLGEIDLDGTYSKYVICHDSSGGGVVG